MVLAADVELLTDGTAKVASQTDGVTLYCVVNDHCDCRDYAQAPHHFCKHRLSAAIARRATELLPKVEAPTVALDVSSTPLPEAPVSIVRRIGDVEECYHCNQECWDILYIPTSSLPAMA